MAEISINGQKLTEEQALVVDVVLRQARLDVERPEAEVEVNADATIMGDDYKTNFLEFR